MSVNEDHPFHRLTPDFILAAAESRGYVTDGRLLALNSYENRVYQIGIEDAQPLIAKFYRPGRWTDEQIREEHAFCFELAAQDLPVVTPLGGSPVDSLVHVEEFPIAFYPRRGGRAPDLDDDENLRTMGRYLARMHTVGAGRPFEYRPAINVGSFGTESVAYVSGNCIPEDLRAAYESLTVDLLRLCDERFTICKDVRILRVHGDCHHGNILWRGDAPHFVDFDDARTGPAIQDLWMMLSGSQSAQEQQLDHILKGYREFRDFNPIELRLIEGLRALRLMHHAAWIARRWQEPAFKRAFPFFDNENFWATHILELREQCAALFEQPLRLIY